jgi:DNA (cytosine-5)-methyltransferase 1
MRRVGVDHWELQGDVNRRLSWRECAAIQGLPPQVAPSGTLLDKYRVVGNAVPPVFGKTLMEEATAQFGS